MDILQVCDKDMGSRDIWAVLLLLIQSSEEIQHLSFSYWELLAELAVSCDVALRREGKTYSSSTIMFLKDVRDMTFMPVFNFYF